MYRHRSGYMVPSNDFGENYLNELDNGLPTHNINQVKACLKHCWDKTRIAIDGGAYIGTWSKHLMNYFDQVIAFEPAKDNYECLTSNISPLNVERRTEALHSESKDMVMELFREDQPYLWQFGSRGIGREQKIRTLRLDDLVLDDVDLIKLNIVGNEENAVRGALDTIKRCKPCVLVNENLDPHRRASKLLLSLGMKMVWEQNRDYLFKWYD